MSIFYKDTDSQDYNEVGIGSDRITVEKLTDIIRKRENLDDVDITLLNAGTKERIQNSFMTHWSLL